METRQAQAFLAVVDEGHFGHAAARLHLAQSVLSGQIAKLERQLGVTLFERTTRRVQITAAGQALIVHARRVVAVAENAQAEMALLAAGQSGRVRVGFVGSATYDVLPRLAQQVRASLPGVDLQVRGELLNPELAAELENGELDLAIMRPLPLPDGLLAVALRDDPLIVAIHESHPLAQRPHIELTDLAEETLVVYPSHERSVMHERVVSACRDAGFDPRAVIQARETATTVVLVAAGQGVAIIPEPVRSLSVEGVRYLSLRSAPTVPLQLIRHDQPSTPAVNRVADLVIGLCAHQTGP